MTTVETRSLVLDRPRIEKRAGGGVTVTGIGVPWDTPAMVGGAFAESWAPDALDEQARNGWTWGEGGSNRSVASLWSHDTGRPLGSVAAGTLRLAVQPDGLRYWLQLPESAADIAEAVARGDVNGASVSFTASNDVWGATADGETSTRKIVSATLVEVSLCLWPTYAATTATISGSPVPPVISPLAPRSIPPAGEQRVGKKISAATATQIQAAIDGLCDLLDGDSDDDDGEIEEASIAAALKDTTEDSEQDSIARAHRDAQWRLRRREMQSDLASMDALFAKRWKMQPGERQRMLRTLNEAEAREKRRKQNPTIAGAGRDLNNRRARQDRQRLYESELAAREAVIA